MRREIDKKNLKIYLLLIAYVLALILVVIHFETILGWISTLFRLFTPLLIGIAIAFIFNRPYEMFRKTYSEKLNMKKKTAKILAIITIYLIAVGIGILLFCLLIPELADNLFTFAENADMYIYEAQAVINELLRSFQLAPIDFSSLLETADKYLTALSDTLKDMLPQIVEITANFISVSRQLL